MGGHCMTLIHKCNCVSEYQDVKYGKGNRVHTPSEKKGGMCTVCGTRKLMAIPILKEDKKK